MNDIIYKKNSKEYYVSLSIVDSVISKINGATISLLCPNNDYLSEFANGDLGITDKLMKSALMDQFNTLTSNTNKYTADVNKYASVSVVNDYNKDLMSFKNNFSSITQSSINQSVKSIVDNIDIEPYKTLEKTVTTTMMESQKPLIDVVQAVSKEMVTYEDIIARKSVLLSLRPLKTKVCRPSVNKGVGKYNKSIGYKGGGELLTSMNVLSNITNSGGSIQADGSYTHSNTNIGATTSRITSVEYSTKDYLKGMAYQYDYINMYNIKNGDSASVSSISGDTDKPKRIILGIYDKDGNILNPNDTLKKIDPMSADNIADTSYKKADWITKTDKWLFGEGTYSWNILNTPVYRWTNGVVTTDSATKPSGVGWEKKKYKQGDTNILTQEKAIADTDIVVSFVQDDIDIYTTYFKENMKNRLKESIITDQEKNDIIDNTIKNVDVNEHLTTLNSYGQVKSSVYKTSYPSNMKNVYRADKIFLKDKNTTVWIDPESEYDMKVIKVLPYTKYIEGGSDTLSEFTYKSFIKNSVVYKKTDNTAFNITIIKNSIDITTYSGVKEYVLDNWNYRVENNLPIIENLNHYRIIVEDDDKIYMDKMYTVGNLPSFGKTLTVYVDTHNTATRDLSEDTVKVVNSQYQGGKIISVNALNNSQLITNEPYSDGYYGYGDDEEKQDIDVIYRQMLTDLDTEPYYIVEGILCSANTQGGSDGGKKWYKLQDALGSTTLLCNAMGFLSADIIPKIKKAMDFFTNPLNSIITIITEKLKKYCTFFSDKFIEVIKELKSLKEKIDKIKDKIAAQIGRLTQEASKDIMKIGDVLSDEVKAIKDKLKKDIADKQSELTKSMDDILQKAKDILKGVKMDKVIFIDASTMDYKCLLDGSYLKNIDILDKKLSFGVDLDLTNTPMSPIKIDIKGISDNDFLSFLKRKGKVADTKDIVSDLSDTIVGDGITANLSDRIKKIEYSTGTFIDGVKYEYEYVDENGSKIIDEINKFLMNTGSLSSDKIRSLLDDAKSLLSKYPYNRYIKNLVSKLQDAVGGLLSRLNPTLNSIISIVSVPIKMAADIIKEIKNIFEDIVKHPLKLMDKIKDFLTFEWIKKFFDITKILKYFDVNIKIKEFVDMIRTFMSVIASKASNLSSDVLAKLKSLLGGVDINKLSMMKVVELCKTKIIDLSDYFSTFITLSFGQWSVQSIIDAIPSFRKLSFKSLMMICLIINAIINFFFSLFALESLFKLKHVKMTPKSDSVDDIVEASSNITMIDIDKPLIYYRIVIDDGMVIDDLTFEQMMQFESDNPDISFTNDF